MKYELTTNILQSCGITFYQIKAIADIPTHGVVKGDMGGWIERGINLSQKGNAWVYGNAKVYGDASVYDNAWVSGNAKVYGDAE